MCTCMHSHIHTHTHHPAPCLLSLAESKTMLVSRNALPTAKVVSLTWMHQYPSDSFLSVLGDTPGPWSPSFPRNITEDPNPSHCTCQAAPGEHWEKPLQVMEGRAKGPAPSPSSVPTQQASGPGLGAFSVKLMRKASSQATGSERPVATGEKCLR